MITTMAGQRTLGRVLPPWWLMLITGIAWIVVSVILLRFDYTSVSAISILFGVVALFAGAAELVNVFIAAGWWKLLYGVLAVVFIATGSEVEIAMDAAERLEQQGIGADVVSMPSTERFDAQPREYRDDILPDVSNREILRVSVEAGTTFGWERYTGLHGLRIGIDRFGVSAKAEDAYNYFGLTSDKIAQRVTDFMKQRGIQ